MAIHSRMNSPSIYVILEGYVRIAINVQKMALVRTLPAVVSGGEAGDLLLPGGKTV